MLLAVEAFAGEHRVQHLVARLVLGLVGLDLLLHPVQIGILLLRVRLGPENGNLVLQVVVLPVDKLNALLALLVLGVLGVEHILEGVHLPPGVELGELDMMGVENGDAAQVHQGADVENLIDSLSGEGRIDRHIAQVAQAVDGRTDGHGGPQLPGSQLGGLERHVTVAPPEVQQIDQPEHHKIGPQQEGPAGEHCGVLPARHNMPVVAVQLPFQRGGELRNDEGADTAVGRVAQRDFTAGGQKAEHDEHGDQNTGQKPAHRQIPRQLQKDAQHRQEAPRRRPEPDAVKAFGQLDHAEHAGNPLGQSGVDAWDIAQQFPVHLLTSPR